MIKKISVLIFIPWYCWESNLVTHCSVWRLCISTGMWECNRIFLKGIWIMVLTGSGICTEVHYWIVKCFMHLKTEWCWCDLVSIGWDGSNSFQFVSLCAGCQLTATMDEFYGLDISKMVIILPALVNFFVVFDLFSICIIPS